MRSETVQTPIGLLTISASGNRMTAKLFFSEELAELDEDTCKARAGKLLQDCPEDVAERIRVMFTDQQLMGAELARKAESFARLSMETERIFKKEGASERFNEIAEMHLKAFHFLSSAIPVLDSDPLADLFFGALILQVFKLQESCTAAEKT